MINIKEYVQGRTKGTLFYALLRFFWRSCAACLRYVYTILAGIYLLLIGRLFPRNHALMDDIYDHFNPFKILSKVNEEPEIIVQDVELKERLENVQLIRYTMYLDIMEFIKKTIDQKKVKDLAIIEFGGSNGIIKLMFRGCPYEIADNYPKVDVQDLSAFKSDHYDFIILDQVLEHVCNPTKAIQEIHRILKKGGWFIVTTPFLIRIHNSPNDYWRFTKQGMAELLSAFSQTTVKSWGNRTTVMDHIKTGHCSSVTFFRKVGLFNLENEEEFPSSMWAFSKK